MKQRRGIRRIIIQASIFLLLGAIVNVAVAWAMAMVAIVEPYQGLVYAEDADASDVWRCCRPPDWPDEPDQGAQQDIVGISERWSRSEGRSSYDEGRCVVERSIGLPLPALRCRIWWWQIDSYIHIVRVDWAWHPPDQSGVVREIDVDVLTFLPLRPIWPGFAINTLFYAAILWLLFAAPLALRRGRRIKRGLCPACAYPVGASDLCTECGMPVKPLVAEPGTA